MEYKTLERLVEYKTLERLEECKTLERLVEYKTLERLVEYKTLERLEECIKLGECWGAMNSSKFYHPGQLKLPLFKLGKHFTAQRPELISSEFFEASSFIQT